MSRMINLRIFRLLCLGSAVCLAGLWVSSVPADAATFQAFNARSTFENAAESPLFTETFDSFDGATELTSLDAGGFTWQATGPVPFNLVEASSDTELVSTSGVDLPEGVSPNFTYTLTFDVPATAFGFDVDDIDTGTVEISVAGQLVNSAGTTSVFFGLISDEPFSSVLLQQVSGGGDGVIFDNISFNAVPSPGALTLLAVWLPAMLMRRRWG